MTWTDDFNRPDGAIDNGWIDIGYTATIASGYPTSEGVGFVLRAFTGSSGAQTATLDLDRGSNDGYTPNLVVKCDADGSDYYLGRLNTAATFYYAQIYKYTSGTPETLANEYVAVPPGTNPSISLSYSGGSIVLSVNGVSRATASDSTFSANTYLGMKAFGGAIKVDTYSDNAPVPATLTISPSESYVASPAAYFSVTLNNATWDGPPFTQQTLSVDHGWMITQIRESTSLASFDYQALGYVGVVTVTDSETGATGTFTTRPYPIEGDGNSWPINEDGAKVLNNADATCEDARVLTSCDELEAGSGVTILKALDAILEQLSGFFGQVGADIGTDGRPANVHTPWYKDSTPSWYTVADMLALLGGTPTLYSHADLRTDLSNAIGLVPTTIQGTDDHTIFDVMQQIAYLRTVNDYTLGTVDGWIDAAVDNIRGSGDPDIAAVITALGAIRTGSNYTLGDVMTAIAAIAEPDLSPVLDKLDTIQPSSTYNLSTLSADVGDVGTTATTILSDLLTLTGDGEITLQMILDAITALANLVPKVPPVWPGADNVTLGESVALSSQLHLIADMDGVIVAITTPPTRTGLYEVGGAPLDYGQGRITFETDSGDLEPWQYLGFRSAIYTPKSMAHASGVRFQMLAGAAGTVTPWTMGA